MRRLVVSLSLLSAPALAQDAGVCDPPVEIGPLEVTPAVGATSVPTDAVIKVRYSPGYFAGASAPTETITLVPAIAGRLELAGDATLYFVPSGLLPANTVVTGSASGGAFPFDFRFTTSSTRDASPPQLPDPRGTNELAIDSTVVDDGCAEPGSRRIGLTFPAAVEFGAPSTSLEYSVYVTRGEGLAAPTLVSRVRDFGASAVTVGFVLAPPLADGPVCVVAVATDGNDRMAAWPEPVCFDPARRLGFVALCAAIPGRRASPLPLAFVAAAGVLAYRRRR